MQMAKKAQMQTLLTTVDLLCRTKGAIRFGVIVG